MSRRPRFVVGITVVTVVLIVLVAGCAPAAGGMPRSSLKKCLAYDGRIQTVAIVLDWGSVSRSTQRQAYDSTVQQVYDNPCTLVRFDIVERKDMKTLLQEQDLVKDAYVANTDGPRLGHALGANYILFVHVDHAGVHQVDSGNLLSALVGTNARMSGYVATVTVSLRLVDTETGVVVARADGSATSTIPSAFNVNGTYGGDDTHGLALKSSMGPAVKKAVNALMVQL